jgi:hypothetical protein
MLDLLGPDGIVSVDVDERENKIRIGFNSLAGRGLALSRLASLGVPPDAFILELQSAAIPALTLTDRVRPLKAGLSIRAEQQGFCTLGFWAMKNSGGKGFFVNSHCTPTGAATDHGHRYFQNDLALIGPFIEDNLFALENWDPPAASCAPYGLPCRYSDAAFVSLFDTVSVHQGYVARTLYAEGNCCGSLAFSTNDDSTRFEVILKAGVYDVVMGEDVQKVGQTTGWTYGRVDQTCSDKWSSALGMTLKCQQRSEAYSSGGDRGSPVFAYRYCAHDPTRCVMLVGMAWGHEDVCCGGSAANRRNVYSKITEIERDFSSWAPFSVVAQ